MRGALMWIASAAICVGMLVLSVFSLRSAGYLGLIGFGLGAVAGLLRPGQTSFGERMGNAYVVSLFGLTTGFLIGALVWAAIALWAPR